MSGRAFVDTNVVVYLFDDDQPAKQARARERLESTDQAVVVSTQVLSEFYVTVTRKLARPLAPDVAQRAVDVLAELPVVPADAELVKAAISTSQRHQLSLWDAMIVEAAAVASCDTLVSEDFAVGTILRGVTVTNPFVE